jgi:hypothetical protein
MLALGVDPRRAALTLPIPAEATFLVTHPAPTGMSREQFDRLVEELEPCSRIPAGAAVVACWRWPIRAWLGAGWFGVSGPSGVEGSVAGGAVSGPPDEQDL